MPQVSLTMYPEEIAAVEKALDALVNTGECVVKDFTREQWSELQDAWCRVFKDIVDLEQLNKKEDDNEA